MHDLKWVFNTKLGLRHSNQFQEDFGKDRHAKGRTDPYSMDPSSNRLGSKIVLF